MSRQRGHVSSHAIRKRLLAENYRYVGERRYVRIFHRDRYEIAAVPKESSMARSAARILLRQAGIDADKVESFLRHASL